MMEIGLPIKFLIVLSKSPIESISYYINFISLKKKSIKYPRLKSVADCTVFPLCHHQAGGNPIP